MSSLTEFLLNRIVEDEERAERWPDELLPPLAPDGHLWVDPHGHPIYAPRSRVLAECAAKRQIIALHGAVEVLWPSRFTAAYCCTGCFGAVQMDTQPDGTPLTPDGHATAAPEPCGTLLALAAPYASHPDFDPSWAGGTQP